MEWSSFLLFLLFPSLTFLLSILVLPHSFPSHVLKQFGTYSQGYMYTWLGNTALTDGAV